MKILLGICGSIASYRSPDLIRQLLADGHELEVVLTKSAEHFVSKLTIESFLRKKILSSDPFHSDHLGTDHIEKARWAEAVFIYGATANTLARLANGFADDFLSLQVLAFNGPLIIAPAMNPSMWNHPAVLENVARLKNRNCRFIGPIHGTLACGESGLGHIADIDEISSCLKNPELLNLQHDLKNTKVLISAGPMQTAIDPARKMANRSSGRMGLELARDARRRGAEVKVLLGPVAFDVEQQFKSFDCIRYTDPQNYQEALTKNFDWSDIFISASAVLDFKIQASPSKISRAQIAEQKNLNLSIEAVPDFVKQVCANKRATQNVVAFALEDGSESEILTKAQKKMKTKNCDWIIANALSPETGPDAPNNQVWICSSHDGPVKKIGPSSKSQVAHAIWNEISPHLTKTSSAAVH